MPPATIRTAPSLGTFTYLADHQSQTPATFYNAKPVLHYHGTGIRALASQDQLLSLPAFAQQTNGQSTPADGEKALVVELLDVYVSSENLTLFNPTTSVGFSLPYPSIALHAIQRLEDPSNSSQQVQGLYMQLELEDCNDEEPEAIELTLIPTSAEDIQKLFQAVSNCSNLHPDPMDEDEDMEDAAGDSRIMFEGSVGYDGIIGLPGVSLGVSDGGLPPPFPGSGGWITAENVGEYFDADGNWIRDDEEGSLGEGAGRVRTRDEADGDELNGDDTDESEVNKRARTG